MICNGDHYGDLLIVQFSPKLAVPFWLRGRVVQSIFITVSHPGR